MRGLHALRIPGVWRARSTPINREKRAPTAIDLHRELNVLKKGELAWMYAVFKCAPQEALRNLDQVYAHFFWRVKEKKAVRRLARAHLRVANVRKNALHQVTSLLATLAPACKCR